MQFKTLDKPKIKGKPVLVRIDINSEIINGKPQLSDRYKSSAKTISELKSKGARVVCLAHQGQPNKRKSEFTSLKNHAKLLNKLTKIKFIPDTLGKKAIKAIRTLKPGQAILLENIRFEKSEYKSPTKSNKLIKTLTPLFDLYVNDAFSVSHRNQISLSGFPIYLPSAIGRTMQKELENAKKVKSKNTIFILGGNKPSDLLPLLKNKKILTGGTLSLLALIAKKYDLGKEKQILKPELKLIKSIKPHLKNLTLPIDLAIQKNKKRVELPLNKFPQNYPIYDIGPNTIKSYIKQILAAKPSQTIFVKGPAGHTGIKCFEKATKQILKSLEKTRAHTIVAGGHSSTALDRFKINKSKINHISLSGGALVRYISGQKLPGLEALKACKKYC